MMPLAMLPAMPSASTVCFLFRPRVRDTASVAAMAPRMAVGWKPALWIAFGMTIDRRHNASMPAAMPTSASSPLRPKRSHAASTAGATTALECTGPPSNVSSKSSPCAAVPLISAAFSAL